MFQYFIPSAIFYGHPDIGVGLYIWKSLIPTTIGNIIGGGFFVGSAYWYLYLTGEGAVDVDFNLGSLDTAMEVGGPMSREKYHKRSLMNGSGRNEGEVIIGEDGNPSSKEMTDLPHSGSHMMSSIGKELSAEKFGARKDSQEKAQV